MKSQAVLLCTALLLGIACACAGGRQFWTAYYNARSKAIRVSLGRDTERGACWGYFEDTIEETGWGKLELWSNRNLPDISQVRACGFLEGKLTHTRVYQAHYNWKHSEAEDDLPDLRKWLKTNYEWVESQNQSDPFWYNVHLLNEQLKYLGKGAGLGESAFYDLEMMNGMDEMSDIVNTFGNDEEKRSWEDKTGAEVFRDLTLKDHCSALIRVLPDNSDIVVSHNTWADYANMLRCIKIYHLPLSKVSTETVMQSGFYGALTSIDDFYIDVETRLGITETTDAKATNDLYPLLTPISVLEWVRSVVACRMAHDGPSFAEAFSTNQSGTYTNQWMIVDFKLFTPGQPLKPWTLTLHEGVPRYVKWGDVTDVLAQKGYWGAYNLPYYPEIQEKMGYPVIVERFGDMFDHEKSPRARIFARDAPNANTIEDVKKLIRKNNWVTDPLSLGYPGCAIAGRFEFKGGPDAGTWGWWDIWPMGAVDGKVTAASLVSATAATMHAISSPTYSLDPADQLPPFDWETTAWQNISHMGQPKHWAFPWVQFSSN